MLNKFVIVASLFCSTFSFAQGMSVEADANRLAQEIAQNGRYLSPAQRGQISQEIATIRGILYNGGGQQSYSEYTCVPKDNDGRAPYVMGIRVGINVTRFAGAVFSSTGECEAGISAIRSFGQTSLACFAKDSDGRQPWVMAVIDGNGNTSKIGRTAVGSQQ